MARRRKPPTPEEARNIHQADMDGNSLGHRFAGWKRRNFQWCTTCALCGRGAFLNPKGGLEFRVFPERPKCDSKDLPPKEWTGLADHLSDSHARANPIMVRAADLAERNGHILTPWKLHKSNIVPVAFCSCLACQRSIVADPALPEPHQILGAACAQPCQLTDAQP